MNAGSKAYWIAGVLFVLIVAAALFLLTLPDRLETPVPAAAEEPVPASAESSEPPAPSPETAPPQETLPVEPEEEPVSSGLEETSIAPEAPVVPDVPRKARRVDFSVLVNGIYTTAPTDDNIYSVQRFEGGARMVLYPDEDIAALYLVWNYLPEYFFLSIDGTRYRYEQPEYLHQYIVLPEVSSNVTLITPSRPSQLCDAYAFTEGTPPEWVQQWETLPDGEAADMLVFPTHSDDEFLFFGGLIPLYAGERGKTVQVVYMNQHAGDYILRTHELLNGLWTAGCHLYPVINPQDDVMPDSYLDAAAIYGYETFVAFQVEQIRRFRPQVIVEHDFNGEYGHPTHILNAYCMADAVMQAADPSSFPESAERYGAWDTPKTYFHLYWENEVVLDYDTPLERFDGATAAEIAERAYQCYWSQHEYYPYVYFDGPYDCHRFGLFRTTVGYDTECSDLFENITQPEI
ncbi:MAG: PIG-L family deacetylase [Oscillospiraceae bacterium]|nr:PIG-L family deacetylase [Oscillospiraceae bacterium]